MSQRIHNFHPRYSQRWNNRRYSGDNQRGDKDASENFNIMANRERIAVGHARRWGQQYLERVNDRANNKGKYGCKDAAQNADEQSLKKEHFQRLPF